MVDTVGFIKMMRHMMGCFHRYAVEVLSYSCPERSAGLSNVCFVAFTAFDGVFEHYTRTQIQLT